MKPFMDEDFLLYGDTARFLYHNHAQKMPIVDYHSHLSPQMIADDHQFRNITELWLGGDHYKWRLMRANGVPEELVTGATPDREKFEAFAKTLSSAVGNPVYHWVYLELKRYFQYDGPLSEETASKVWKLCNSALLMPHMTARGLMHQSGVRLLCTTDDPLDDLRFHKAIAQNPVCEVAVLPTFRPDRVLDTQSTGFMEYMEALSAASGLSVDSYSALLEALSRRMDFFASMGCRLSDHAMAEVPYHPAQEGAPEAIFQRIMREEECTAAEHMQLKTALLSHMASQYARRGWTMQLHIGALRNVNRRMHVKLGPDSGYDHIAPPMASIGALGALMNDLETAGLLPKTVLYSLNPLDNAVLAALAGCFQDGVVPGKVQHGSAWWFNDTYTGIRAQLQNLAEMSALGRFVGMLTDSRSFSSFVRHEYFRRILCDLLGEMVDRGQIYNDMAALGKLVEDISYNNAVEYFGFKPFMKEK